MKLYRISQTENVDYDTYDSAVVAAPDEHTARIMNPATGEEKTEWLRENNPFEEWCYSPDQVTVEYIGEAAEGIKQGVICASFNAG